MTNELMTALSGTNADFIAELYSKYRQSPTSVDQSWVTVFDALNDDERSLLASLRGASWSPAPTHRVIGVAGTDAIKLPATKPGATSGLSSDQVRQATKDSVRALFIIRSYRIRGHMQANLDPLGLQAQNYHPDLDYKTYGFTDADLDRPIFLDGVMGMETATLRQIMEAVKRTYCGNIGVEYMHIQDPLQKDWIQQRIEEDRNHTDFTLLGKKRIYERLVAAEGFERFLDKKFTGTKRFGLEGGEALVPALEQIIKRGGQLGLKEIVFGMAHRGRLNVLTNVMGKSFTAMFSEFQGMSATPDSVQGSGDVKYHLGTSSDREFDGIKIHLSLTANPSHLEAVNPVVLGKVRAKLYQRAGSNELQREHYDQVVGLLIHGDAAFAGQGMIAEGLMMSELKGYTTGGTIHFIINNQIGFTTSPAYARSGVYCTDVAKMIQAPILHVNGDDPEAVVHCARIAIEYRQKFHRDVVVDITCYRRHGHNETDEPAFTQPLMYKKIKVQKTTRELYGEKLVAEGNMIANEPQLVYDGFLAQLEDAHKAASSYKPNKADWLEGRWSGLSTATDDDRRGDTGVSMEMLREVGLAISEKPKNFDLNPKIARQLEAKREMIETGKAVDWAMAEGLAFGTLCVEGTLVRLSGQDVGRGTFSHRHAILHDQSSEARYLPVNHIRPGQARLEVFDSPLSEEGVLGFEYGFSLAEPMGLTLWEGQFGDFVNGAQVIIDQFIASGETKWLRMSGLVMLLPHGFEGQGPEHSSARLERFLQLCAEDNMQVVNCTTPANYFHALRRQMKRNFRKPLIVMSPKSLLRHKLVVSDLTEFGPKSSFHRVIHETATDMAADAKIRRVVLCSGKVYYDLLSTREERKIKDVAILRLEQFYPFPDKALFEMLKRYPKADLVWCQEEPENQGAWWFLDRRLEAVLAKVGSAAKRPLYAGRPAAAAPATGSLKRHNKEQAELIDAALAG